ncbi:MAG: MnhB domain-containing protein [Verrucomicrobiales bacterium]|nr:MnhB domain-containing protein [Verrucomicrobiales bacterium]
MKWLALIAVIATGSLLIYAVSDFPDWGSASSPANGGVEGAGRSVSQTFIEETDTLTHVPNIVTAVLADYRGYDTMFETVVILAAGMAIFAILRVLRDTEKPVDQSKHDPSIDGDHQRIIIGTTCRLLIPVIQLFALYVVAHGHHSPGGGFQGGVILGASFILLGLATDLETAIARFSEKQFIGLACVGIFIYAGFGVLGQFYGRGFLDYGALQPIFMTDGEPMARSHAMLGVEVGVAFTVTAIMFAIYANLASKGELKNGL